MKTKYRVMVLRSAMLSLLMFFSLPGEAEELAAELDWAELHYASVPVEGFVDEVLVQVGQRVTRGDKLLQLNTTVLSALVQQSRARVAALQPALKDSKREYRDAQTLYEQTVLSDVELQRAKMTFDIASAKLAEAEAQLAMNSAMLGRTLQTAPWDGWVIARQVETGQVIAGDLRAQPLIILARAEHMVAQARVSFEIRNRLQIGQVLKVRYRDQTYPAKVQSLAVAPHSKADATYAIRVVFAVDAVAMLRLGDSASILMP